MIEMTATHAQQAETKSGKKAPAKTKLKHDGHAPEGNGDVAKYALTMMADCLDDADLNAEERKEALWMFFDLLLTSFGPDERK